MKMKLFVIIEYIKRFILQGSRVGACSLSMFGIVPVVTSLAECSKVLRVAVLRRMVEMCDGENNPNDDRSVKVFLSCLWHKAMILNSTELTTVIRSL